MTTALQSSANIAANQLASIPFGTLLGEPLDAAVKAQAYAANTTAEYIQSVGMQEDSLGNLKAVNVRFYYQNASGATRILIVPLLILIPIPFLEINSLTLDFKAKITASGEIGRRSASSEARQRQGYVRAKSGWYFDKFVKVRGGFSAGVSSKKDSVATQSSKYSVEYTMNVNMQAGQAGVPAGMSAVLSMLESALLDRAAEPEIKLLTQVEPEIGVSGTLEIDLLVLGADGSAVEGATVSLELTEPDTPSSGISINGSAPSDPLEHSVTTSSTGGASVTISRTAAVTNSPEVWVLKAEVTVDGTTYSDTLNITAIV